MTHGDFWSRFVWLMGSWIACLVVIEAVSRSRRPLKRIDAGDHPARPADLVADLFESATTRQGSIAFAKTTAVAVVFTLICAVALIIQLIGAGFVRLAEIRFGTFLFLLGIGLAVMLLPHYWLCRWLKRVLRLPDNPTFTDWLTARLVYPGVAFIVVFFGGAALFSFAGTAIGDFLARNLNPFPTIPNLFTYPGAETSSEARRMATLLALFAIYPLAMQFTWAVAALLGDAAASVMRAGRRQTAAVSGAKGDRRFGFAMMLEVTAVHLMLLPVLL